ncbi:MAG: hypothetical protein LUH19_04860 [Lachnospiraceae bacterium]|nr:hypothetical protein [Lachnospiraceae bacterium]
MYDTGYIDLLNDPEIISYESPACKRYQRTLVFLYILALLEVIFVIVIPPLGVIALIITIILIVRQTKKLNKYLHSVQEEIRSSGKKPEWWNDRCKKYRKLSKLPLEKRMKRIPGSGTSYQTAEPNKTSSGGATTAQKAVVNTAAAYGLGKAATSAVKNTSPEKRASKNLHSNDAMAAREKARSGQNLRGNQSKERITVKGKTYYITTMPNGNQTLTDASNRCIGKYDKTRNVTTNGSAKKIGNGNLLKTLM